MSLASGKKRHLANVDKQPPTPKKPRLGRKQLTDSDYTIGWIAAIDVERAAALAALDEEHESLPQQEGDSNSYSFGTIGRHNVVITSLPQGGYGTVNAATVASNMHRSFPSLKEYLMVGIAGGAGVTGTADVRLGDVVVGSKVVQYDLGKDLSDGDFKTTSIPLKPSPRLLGAVQALAARHMLASSQIPAILRQMSERYLDMKGSTGRELLQDQLFDAAYHHAGSNEDCSACDRSYLIDRKPRKSNPKIHTGVIASGNAVIKSPSTRDRLVREHNALCFEMEGAGIIENLRCLVIRSICDYADSHKNKRWQPYAAAVAAAYAKELLGEIASLATSCVTNSGEKALQDLKRELMDSLSFQNLYSREMHIASPYDNTCEWILHHPDYLMWLDREKYPQNHGFFWVRGKPGAGKSTLTKFVYRTVGNDSDAVSFFFNGRGHDLEKSAEGMYRSLLFQLLRKFPDLQRVFEKPYLLHSASFGGIKWDIKVLQEIFHEVIAELGDREIFCFIDALDECNESEVEEIVEFLDKVGNFASQQNIKLFTWLSSRHYPAIPVIANLTLVLETEHGHNKDLENYINQKLEIGTRENTGKIRLPLLQKAAGIFMWVVLVVSILNKEFQSGRLFAVEKKLLEIPAKLNELFKEIITKDDSNLAEFLLSIQWILFAKYSINIEEYYYALAAGWGLEKATVAEWDPKPTTDDMRRFVVSSSKGLAEATKFGRVQFIHESVRDFLIKDGGIGELWPELRDAFEWASHEELKRCCYKYIKARSSDIDNIVRHFRTSDNIYSLRNNPGKTSRQYIAERFPLLPYAVDCVLFHANKAAIYMAQDVFLRSFDFRTWSRLYYNVLHPSSLPGTILSACVYNNYPQLISTIVRDHHITPMYRKQGEHLLFTALRQRLLEVVDSLLQIGDYQSDGNNVLQHLPHDWKYTPIGNYTPLSLAAEAGHERLVQLLLNDDAISPDEADPQGDRPLIRAAQRGHERIADMLLDKGALIDLKNIAGETSFFKAVFFRKQQMAEILLRRGADVNSKAENGNTPLIHAIRRGSEFANLLLNYGADVNVEDKYGQTPLAEAIRLEYDKETISLFLAKGAKLNVCNKDGMSPLAFAAQQRSKETVKLLLAKGAKLNMSDKISIPPILFAAEQGSREIIKLLLVAGTKVNVSDKNGMSPLAFATKQESEETIKLLLVAGAEVNVSNKDGMTPLLWAIKGKSTRYIVKELLAKGADANAVHPNGKTALQLAIARYDTGHIADQLVARGADVNLKALTLIYATRMV
ncbi:ankyrin repeat-containing domain protein [Hypoxylon argillaceum]|nr:ankyrin repeat-containing domain protein [Hypoxylon argillaceum]